jgi:hypothetical protein
MARENQSESGNSREEYEKTLVGAAEFRIVR